MKNMKGFTMIELLGIMTIIGVLLIMTVPNLTSTLKNSEKKSLEEFEDNLLIAAETYVTNNPELFPSLKIVGGRTVISIEDLIKNDLIEKVAVDPKTETEVPISNTIVVTKGTDGTLNYGYTAQSASIASYVQEDLLLLYDGYNKPTGVWKDLSGNNKDGKLVDFTSESWNGDSINFDGNGYIDLATHLSGLYDGSNTIEIVGQFDGTNANNFIIGNSNINIQKTGLQNNFNYGSIAINTNNFYTNNTKTSNAYVFDKTNNSFKAYYNTTLKETNTNSFATNYNFDNVKIGFNEDKTVKLKGKIYSVRIYDKVLTEEEISKNFSVDKVRFGLRKSNEDN